MTSKRRAELRSEAHHLKPLVHIGQHGLTPTVLQTVDDALRTRELVKLQLTRTANDAMERHAVADELAKALRADIVQVIGRTMTLYRHNPKLERKADLPPWRE